MRHQQHKKKKIVVVSTFSGMDLFMLGLVASGMLPGYAIERNIYAALMHADNFRNPDGSSVIEFVDISQDEFERRKKYQDQKGKRTLEDTCIKKDGRYLRAKEIHEVSGNEIREDLERKYGKDLIIILIGGPPCQDFTKLNSKKKTGNGSRNYLVFEYLRILDELEPDIGIMEEVPELKTQEFEDIYEAFIKQALTMPYMIAEQEMRSIHYGGNQNRERIFILFVHKKLGVDPEFPEADEVNVKSVRDFLDIDYFCHGIYNYCLKDKNHFMPTVTSTNPTAFFKDGKKYQPPIDDLLLCFDAEKGMYRIPEGIPQAQIRKAIGNAVCVSVSKALAKTITEKILRVRPLDDGYWVSIDDEDDPYDDVYDPDDYTPDQRTLSEVDLWLNEVLPFPQIKPLSMDEKGGDEAYDPDDYTPDQRTLSEVDLWLNEVLPYPQTKPLSMDEKGSKAVEQAVHHTVVKSNPVVSPINSVQIFSSPKLSIKVPSNTTCETPVRKIISSLDLAGMKFNSLLFTDKWEQFLGHPSVNFSCVIHGKPGGGKSTFTIQFAKYLSDNFGKVIYISGEEGFSMTLQNKFSQNGSTSAHIDVADLKSYDEIIKQVGGDSYQFICLDSLSTMNISPAELREIRNIHKKSAVISICQATKGGLLRGSNEFIHDSDIHVMVENGIATTPKNRFKIADNSYYSVFLEEHPQDA